MKRLAVLLGLLGTCAGFFTIHAAAVGSLNRKLSSGQGRANALYVLFYYIGGWLGITGSGLAYKQGGWSALICISMLLRANHYFDGERLAQKLEHPCSALCGRIGIDRSVKAAEYRRGASRVKHGNTQRKKTAPATSQ